MDYPHINPHVSKVDLIDYFTMTQNERYHLPQGRKEGNILGFAVLLKTFSYLGFPTLPNLPMMRFGRAQGRNKTHS